MAWWWFSFFMLRFTQVVLTLTWSLSTVVFGIFKSTFFCCLLLSSTTTLKFVLLLLLLELLLLLLLFNINELFLRFSSDSTSELSGEEIWLSLRLFILLKLLLLLLLYCEVAVVPVSVADCNAADVVIGNMGGGEFAVAVVLIVVIWLSGKRTPPMRSESCMVRFRLYLMHLGWWHFILLGDSVRVSGVFGKSPSLRCWYWYLERIRLKVVMISEELANIYSLSNISSGLLRSNNVE